MKKKLEIQEVKKIYFEENKTLKEVGDILGYTASGVRKFLIKNNIKTKKQNFNSKNCKNSMNITFFENINSSSKAYVLGLLLSDGYISKKWSKVVLTSKDYELVDIVRKELNSTHKLSEYDVYDKRTNKTYKRFSLQIPSKKMCVDLNCLGLQNNKSFDCEYPNINDDYFWDFVRGVFDGDGSISKMNKEGILRFSIIGSENFILKLKEKFNSFGLTDTKIIYTKYKSERGCICKLLYYSFEDLDFIKNNMYNNSDGLRLSRKYEIFQTLKEHNRGAYDRTPVLKPVKMYGLNGVLIKEFKNIHDATTELEITSEMIYRVIRGERKKTKGYKFSY